jgi:ATP-dependent Lon protease
LDIRAVKWIDEVLEIALQRMPKPISGTVSDSDVVEGKEEAGEDSRDPLTTH